MLQRLLLAAVHRSPLTPPAAAAASLPAAGLQACLHVRGFSEAAVAGAEPAAKRAVNNDPATDSWWRDAEATALQGAKILRQRLEKFGPQRVVHLLEIVRRIRTPEEAAAAVDAAQKFALHRARRGQHSVLSPELTAWIVRKVAEAGDVRLSLDVLRRSPELAMSFSRAAFAATIVRASGAADLRTALNALEVMKASGLRPNRDIAFHITQACFECGRPDLAVAYCKEFEANGLPPRPIVAKRVQEAEAQLRGEAAPETSAAGDADAEAPSEGGEDGASSEEGASTTADGLSEAGPLEAAAAEEADAAAQQVQGAPGEGQGAAATSASAVDEEVQTQGSVEAPAAEKPAAG